MPSSEHKILIHREDIIYHSAVLPIEQLSEDAQQSRKKHYKLFRLHHARQYSRSAANEHVFYVLSCTSDSALLCFSNSSTCLFTGPCLLGPILSNNTVQCCVFSYVASEHLYT